MKEIVFKEESYAIIGACFEFYNEKGCGFLEPVYQECLQIEFEHQRIPAIAKPALTLSYRGRPLLQTYEADFICYGKIIIELKATATLADEHRAQLLNYLHATGFQLGPARQLRPSSPTGIRAHRTDGTQKEQRQCLLLIHSRLFA
jgi:GxxExxY protein